MMHLPKRRPWLILVGIYLVIMALWGTVFFLARQNGDQQLDAEEAEKLINQSARQPTNKPADHAE